VSDTPDSTNLELSGVSKSLLLPLYIRALETNRPDAILRDNRAVELVQKLGINASSITQAKVSEEVQISIVLRNRQFDRFARNYLTLHPEAVVVHLGCGLDTRFERVDNGQVEWYDLDLPEVIELRRKFIDDEGKRHHLLASSALDPSWIDTVKVQFRPVLFMAEGLFMFFERVQVVSLVLALKDRFPNSELVFDAFSPFYLWGNNRRVARTHIGEAAQWALKGGKELAGWGDNIQLLEEWYPFLHSEPRLAHIRWVRYIPFLYKTSGIFRYKLG
jgi:O-methyltransferase involved in polyketide biosynthesis